MNQALNAQSRKANANFSVTSLTKALRCFRKRWSFGISPNRFQSQVHHKQLLFEPGQLTYILETWPPSLQRGRNLQFWDWRNMKGCLAEGSYSCLHPLTCHPFQAPRQLRVPLGPPGPPALPFLPAPLLWLCRERENSDLPSLNRFLQTSKGDTSISCGTPRKNE